MLSPVDHYLQWNAAVAKVVFTEELAGRPVFLDMDEPITNAIGEHMGVPAGQVEDALCESVRSVLRVHDAGVHVFRDIDEMIGQWGRRSRALQGLEPPVIALLAVFVLAAERMGRKDAAFQVGQHAYYDRLCRLMAVSTADRQRFVVAFRDSSEGYWEVLARWLDALGGRRGVPSASPYGHRFVGLPISQALIRRAERERLPELFAGAGLLPGEVVDSAEMTLLLSQWIDHGHGVSKRFRDLWKQEPLRERIAEIAVRELEVWTGETGAAERADRPTDSLRLIGWWGIGSLLRKEPVLGVGVPGKNPGPWQVAGPEDAPSATGDHVKDELVRLTARSLALDASTLLESRVAVQNADGRVCRRNPTGSVLLALDEASGTFIERQRAAHGHTYWFLVRTAVPDMTERVEQFFRQSGSSATLTPGPAAPQGWSLYTNVQIGMNASSLAEPPHVSLRLLVPQQRLRIELAGGLKLPGNGDRYSVWAPPVVVPVDGHTLELGPRSVQGAGPMSNLEMLQILQGHSTQLPVPEGDVVLVRTDQANVEEATTRTLRLRGPESSDAEPIGEMGFVELTSIAACESASEIRDDNAATVQGALSRGAETSIKGVVPGQQSWTYSKPTQQRNSLSLPQASEVSCLWDGTHPVDVNTSDDGKLQIQRYTCCGRVLITRTRPRRKQRGPGTPKATPPPMTATQVRASDEALRDSLIYLGSGSAAAFRKVTEQSGIEKRPAELVDDLAATGFLEVNKDASGSARRWSVCPPALSEADGGRILATGAWSVAALSELGTIVDDEGGAMELQPMNEGGMSIITGVSADTLFDYETTMTDVVDAGDAADRLIRRLPSLSSLLPAAERVELPGRAEWEAFPTGHLLGWTPVSRPDAPGLYRVQLGWSRKTYLVTPSDVGEGTGVLVSTCMGKHLAASMQGRHLLRYNPRGRHLEVPLGARLPGLFERATCLLSGRLPTRTPDGSAYRYTHVTEDFAALLAGRL